MEKVSWVKLSQVISLFPPTQPRGHSPAGPAALGWWALPLDTEDLAPLSSASFTVKRLVSGSHCSLWVACLLSPATFTASCLSSWSCSHSDELGCKLFFLNSLGWAPLPSRVENGASISHGRSWAAGTFSHPPRTLVGSLNRHTSPLLPLVSGLCSAPFLQLLLPGCGIPWWLSGEESSCQGRR